MQAVRQICTLRPISCAVRVSVIVSASLFTTPASCGSISSSAICWLMSSCRSRATRERSVSCAFNRRDPRSRIRS
jgi:hypothetical protein